MCVCQSVAIQPHCADRNSCCHDEGKLSDFGEMISLSLLFENVFKFEIEVMVTIVFVFFAVVYVVSVWSYYDYRALYL